MKTEQRREEKAKQGNREVFSDESLERSKRFNCGTTPKGEGKTITISQRKLLCEACIIQPRELIYQDHSMVKL